MVRLAIVTNSLSSGGAERWACQTANGLSTRSMDVELIALSNERQDYELAESIALQNMGHRGAFDTVRTLFRIRRLLSQKNYDVVVTSGNYTGQFLGQVLVSSKLPTAWLSRFSLGLNSSRRSLQERLGWAWFSSVLRRADKIIANSSGVAGGITARWPQLSDRLHLIRNGVDLAQIEEARQDAVRSKSSSVPLIVSTGRLARQKRPDLFVDAIAMLRERTPCQAVWCGDGPLRDVIQSQINRAGLAESVRLLGFCRDAILHIAESDCFVLCSDFEGSPNVIAEAMALGKSIVSTDCPYGPRELLGEDRGRLCPSGDANELANKLEQALKEPGQFGTRARRWAEDNLCHEKILDQWAGLIEDSAKCRGRV